MKKFNEIIEKIGNTEDFFFVQIGSNDGMMNDPLYEYIKKYNWSGIMVEPVPYLYDRLVENYKDRDNLIFKNVAVAETEDVMKFYYLKDDEYDKKNMSDGWHGLGSFKKDVIYKFRGKLKHFDTAITTMDVQTITFDSLVSENKNIDLLHIDTEGYDFEIIKSIDLQEYNISVILFENQHIYGCGVRDGTSRKTIL